MKALRWFVLSGLYLAVLFYGFLGDSEGAQRLAIFWAWFLSVTSLVLFSDKGLKEITAKGNPMPVPGWVEHLYNVVVISAFVWHGALWTAGAYAVHLLAMINLFAYLKNKENQS